MGGHGRALRSASSLPAHLKLGSQIFQAGTDATIGGQLEHHLSGLRHAAFAAVAAAAAVAGRAALRTSGARPRGPCECWRRARRWEQPEHCRRSHGMR